MPILRLLDKHRPYATVVGLPPVCYQQDGHYFHRDGSVAREPVESSGGDALSAVSDTEPVVSDTTSPSQLPTPAGLISDVTSTPAALTAPSLQASESKVKPDDMRLAANKALKLQMENYGEEWVSVAHARQFLGIKD